MNQEILKNKYLEEHGALDDYLDVLVNLCETFPDFVIDVENLYRSQVSADFAQYIKDNLDNVDIAHSAFEFIKRLYSRPQDEFDAVSEDFAIALKNMLDSSVIDISSLDSQIQDDIADILQKEGF